MPRKVLSLQFGRMKGGKFVASKNSHLGYKAYPAETLLRMLEEPPQRVKPAKKREIARELIRRGKYTSIASVYLQNRPGHRKNARRGSYRKVKKDVRKAKLAGLLEPGGMFPKWRKAMGVSKSGRKRKGNPAGVKFYKVWFSTTRGSGGDKTAGLVLDTGKYPLSTSIEKYSRLFPYSEAGKMKFFHRGKLHESFAGAFGSSTNRRRRK